MYGDHMSGWDWVWLTLMMSFWIVLLGAVIFLAVRLAQSNRGGKTQP